MRGYHVRDVWEPSIGEKLVARQEFDNPMDKFAVQVLKSSYTVGHFSRTWRKYHHGSYRLLCTF